MARMKTSDNIVFKSMWNSRNSNTDGRSNVRNHMENSLVLIFKFEDTYILWPTISTPQCETNNKCVLMCILTYYIYGNIIHNIKKLEKAQMSINGKW